MKSWNLFMANVCALVVQKQQKHGFSFFPGQASLLFLQRGNGLYVLCGLCQVQRDLTLRHANFPFYKYEKVS